MLLWIYLAGVAIGLIVMRDSWGARLVTAALWPLGPAAFAVVTVILVVAATLLWPVPLLVTFALAALLWWAL